MPAWARWKQLSWGWKVLIVVLFLIILVNVLEQSLTPR
jgi:galactitol-specific phosphotransferase system IIC component